MIKQVYEQVYDYIESDVMQHNPGEFLHSEVQYSNQLCVSRLTVRKAVNELVRIGLVKRIAGKGLMISDDSFVQTHGKLLISCICVVGDSDIFRTVLGCVEAANSYKYEYKLINCISPKQQYEAIKSEDLTNYDGAIITCFDSEFEHMTLKILQDKGIPVVIVGNEQKNIASIMNDDYNGGYLIGDYLAQHGHKDILFLSTDRKVSYVDKRVKGFIQALEDNNIEFNNELLLDIPDPGNPIYTGLSNNRPLPQSADRYLNRDVKYTALTGYSTLPILSFCYRFYLMGINIPNDISVVAYGDQPYMPWQDLPLTGIIEPKEEMGTAAVETMNNYLSGKTQEIESRMLPVRFLHQKSVKTLISPQK